MQTTVHEGLNVKRFREMQSIKQEALAYMLGEEWSQKKISQLEQKEKIEPELLSQIADALKVPVKAFQTLTEEQAITIISNTFNSHDQSNGLNVYPTINVNPTEKWLEALEEIKRLNAELLKVKDEQIKMLERLLGK